MSCETRAMTLVVVRFHARRQRANPEGAQRRRRRDRRGAGGQINEEEEGRDIARRRREETRCVTKRTTIFRGSFSSSVLPSSAP